MLCEYGLGRADLARRIDTAVGAALDAGVRTPDLGGQHSSKAATDAVLAALDRLPA